MKFDTVDECQIWLTDNKMYHFDGGSQGECYKIDNKVYKIFNQFIDDGYCDSGYSKDGILKFSSIKNKTYIWPTDIILVGDMIVGYIMNYVNGKSLWKINPLLVNLNRLEKSLDIAQKDIKIISDNGVLSYDVCYNILYGRNGFKIIDTLEYTQSLENKKDLFMRNSSNMAYEVKLFLVDGFFDDVVIDDALLSEMYISKDVGSIEFLKEFKKRLSEIEDREIVKLGDAKKSICLNKKKYHKYIRNFY